MALIFRLTGEYYLTVKDNVCVVCGKTESYLRKYIVPHEYRKFFPGKFLTLMSHDLMICILICVSFLHVTKSFLVHSVVMKFPNFEFCELNVIEGAFMHAFTE